LFVLHVLITLISPTTLPPAMLKVAGGHEKRHQQPRDADERTK